MQQDSEPPPIKTQSCGGVRGDGGRAKSEPWLTVAGVAGSLKDGVARGGYEFTIGCRRDTISP